MPGGGGEGGATGIWWPEARDAAEHPTMHMTARPQEWPRGRGAWPGVKAKVNCAHECATPCYPNRAPLGHPASVSEPEAKTGALGTRAHPPRGGCAVTSRSTHLVSSPCCLENVSFPNGHWQLSLWPLAEVVAGPGPWGRDCHSDLRCAPPAWPLLRQRLVLGKLTWRWFQRG